MFRKGLFELTQPSQDVRLEEPIDVEVQRLIRTQPLPHPHQPPNPLIQPKDQPFAPRPSIHPLQPTHLGKEQRKHLLERDSSRFPSHPKLSDGVPRLEIDDGLLDPVGEELEGRDR